MTHQLPSRPSKLIQFIAVTIIAFAVTLDTAAATTKIEGEVDSLQLSVDNASTREILDALSSKFKLTYSIPTTAGRQLTGRFSGALSEVLSRVLDGTDYILEVSEGATKVVVLGRPGRAIASTGGKKDAPSTAPVAELPPPQPSVRPATQPSVPPLASFLTVSSIVANEPRP
jgi:hypothetical protein